MRIDRRARKAGRPDYIPTTLLTTQRAYAIGVASSLFEGRLRRHPEGGAGSGVLRRAACNRSPREARDPARQALRPGCEELAARIRRQLPAAVGRRAPKETEARPRGPKPPRWSAERRASRVMGRKAPRKRLACRVICTS